MTIQAQQQQTPQAQQPPAMSEAQQFDALFNGTEQTAVDAGGGGAVAQPGAQVQNPPNPEGGSGAEGGEPSGSAAAPGGEDDWISQLDPAAQQRARDALKREQDRYQALHGRLAPIQRALASTQGQLAELQCRQQQTPQERALAHVPTAGAQQTDSFFDSEYWKRYEEDFPGDAKVMRQAFEHERSAGAQRLAALEARLAQFESGVSQRIGQVSSVTEKVALQEQITALEEAHPDWQQLNDSDEFWDWFDGYRASMPDEVRSAYYDQPTVERWFRNADWTSRVLSQFKRETGYAAPAQQHATQANSAQPTGHQPVQQQPSGGARLRMAAAPDLRSSTGPIPAQSLEAMSEKEQFEALFFASQQR